MIAAAVTHPYLPLSPCASLLSPSPPPLLPTSFSSSSLSLLCIMRKLRSYTLPRGTHPVVCVCVSLSILQLCTRNNEGIRTASASTASLTVEQVYEDNPFTDTEDHGPWTQGFPLKYNNDEWDDVPLKIWVVPHSHNVSKAVGVQVAAVHQSAVRVFFSWTCLWHH